MIVPRTELGEGRAGSVTLSEGEGDHIEHGPLRFAQDDTVTCYFMVASSRSSAA